MLDSMSGDPNPVALVATVASGEQTHSEDNEMPCEKEKWWVDVVLCVMGQVTSRNHFSNKSASFCRTSHSNFEE